MKIESNKSSLLKGIQIVQTVVADKTVLPILSNIMIETSNGGITLSATDLKTSIIYNLDLKVFEKGAITVSAKKIADIVRELPDAKIEIKVEGHKLKILCGKINFQVFGLAKEDFPKLPKLEKVDEKIKIKTTDFKNIIKKTVFAAAQDESRQILNGCLLTCKDSILRLLATNGHRLASIELKGDYADIKQKSL